MGRIIAFLYGLVSYLIFLGSFLYAIAFIGDFWAPKTINSGETGSLITAIIIDAILLSLFAIQHSGMARPAFKRWWTKIIPKPVERSTYVLFASLILILMFWQWRPLNMVIWDIQAQAARATIWSFYGVGWFIVLSGTHMISHAHLFGLKQVYEHLTGEKPSGPKFMKPGYYKFVRHPLMLGFFIAFWATPAMTLGHLLFSFATTGYILIALRFEEHDLIKQFGEKYRKYREEVPMFIPRFW